MSDFCHRGTRKKVSVCMATYNGERFLRQQIESILCQLNSEDELIISDDGSTDATISIIEDFHDSRIKLIHHHRPLCKEKYYRTNIYVAANFENALKNSSGEYIFLSDQDDVWREDKIEKMIEVLDEKDGVVMSSFQVIRADGRVKQEKVTPKIPSFINGILVAKFLGSSMGMTKAFLQTVLPFPKNTISHDSWIGLMALYHKQLSVTEDTLFQYRRHGKNVTSKIKKVPLYAKLKYRAGILYHILKNT